MMKTNEAASPAERPELIEPARVVEEARRWLGSRWRHQGRRRKGGAGRGDPGAVDCIGLVIGVAQALGLFTLDVRDYSPYPDGERLRAELDRALLPVPRSELAEGQIALLRGAEHPSHVAIVAGYPRGGLALIHAYSEAGKVVEHRLDPEWRELIEAAYKLPGVGY